ncbi:uncharacterized protein LOC143083025 [Mytilus galloprovincialis]|uniref:uncharacterized protein LOC143083025 n=1 Tax=Mytilus galloprovincialis TaxID=29158 RepID=UPI003F7C1A87
MKNSHSRNGRFGKSVDDVARQSKQTIQMKTERKELASDYETIRFWIDNKFHLANKIEQDICQQGIDLNIENIFENIACFDCTRKCSHGEGIHVIVELPDIIEDFNLHDISLLMKSTIKNKHSIQCWSVIFCRQTSLTRYKNSKGSFNRFILRDDYINSRIHHHIVFTHIHQQEDNGIERIVENCPSCETKTLEPLDWKCFNNLKEWQLGVPLHMQILFENFINSNSIKKSKDLKALVEQKISCVYSLYDTLLNIFNRTYIGVLQIRNTEELLLNYRNIQTVFDITSDTGTTLSLKEAERQLKEKADIDLCYYNTYLKRHSFPYVTIDEQSKSRLCLRDCVLVLMLDNLVRLRFHSDPDPGENRSQQICTLPVTIKGLPHDSNVTRDWHDDMCDLVNNCNCRKRCNINKTDGLNSLTVLTEEESSDIKKFCQLIQWSIVECWKTIKIEPYIKTLLAKVQPSIETEREEHSEGNEDTIDYDFFDVSMASLQINESQILETSLQSLGAALSELDVSIESVEDDLFEIKLQSFEEETPDNSTEIEDRTGIEEDITDLTRALLNAELPFDPESFILEADKRDIEDLHSVFHDESVNSDGDNSENNSEKIYPTLIEALNFKAYDAPSLLCRHPPPYTGRDDDESKLREILDDILIKSDQQQTYKDGQNRILFAPDHKIGKNLISLMKKCSKYQIFLPEFPILHLRKSRICNIFSGYKNAGLVHLLKYMRDDNTDEWSKLLSERCIDDATTVIWRLSLSLHLSFFLQFIMQLPSQKLKEIIKDMDDKNYNLLSFWDNQLCDFIEHGTNRNATFTLHKEMMNHCDEVLAIAFSERLGGCKGYSLLLAAVKSSLPFVFLNGASSYAAYTTHLLHEHYTAGMYHQKLKMALYSTPHRTGTVNFGLDSQREMDQRDVVKGFRS